MNNRRCVNYSGDVFRDMDVDSLPCIHSGRRLATIRPSTQTEALRGSKWYSQKVEALDMTDVETWATVGWATRNTQRSWTYYKITYSLKSGNAAQSAVNGYGRERKYGKEIF